MSEQLALFWIYPFLIVFTICTVAYIVLPEDVMDMDISGSSRTGLELREALPGIVVLAMVPYLSFLVAGIVILCTVISVAIFIGSTISLQYVKLLTKLRNKIHKD